MMRQKTAITIIFGIGTILIVGSSSALATLVQFNERDFEIRNFGFKDGAPWLTVTGNAGGSKPDNASQIYAYAFVTDKGIYAVVSHGVEDSAEVQNDTEWHSHGVTLGPYNCVTKLNDDGNAEVGREIKVLNTTATKVDKVMTAILGVNNADAKVCVEKIMDSNP
jgi:hypothetical protein